jgi:2-methylaconitate cis-trans-isomerase PrpF
MTKRVLLSNNSPGLFAAVDADLADLAVDASGNGSNFLAGDGTFKAAGGGLQTVTVTLTSAQLLNLNTSPVTIIAAPGAGNAIIPLLMGFIYMTPLHP